MLPNASRVAIREDDEKRNFLASEETLTKGGGASCDAKCSIQWIAMEVGKCGCGRGCRPHHCGRTSPSRHRAHPFSRFFSCFFCYLHSLLFLFSSFLFVSLIFFLGNLNLRCELPYLDILIKNFFICKRGFQRAETV